MEALEDVLIPIVAIVSVFGSPVLLAIIVARVLKHRSEERSEQLNKLLDKFATADELLAFAETEAGSDLIESITVGPRRSRSHVAKSVHRGIVSSALGIGCLVLAWAFMYEFLLGGVLLLTLGLGFLVSAWIAHRYLQEDESEVEPVFSETSGQ